ncbi:hypothetical protein FRC06_003897 [Ceratobasidium sp. 370]|nr:hypothetical protein FRC06_003897 [Ceratobasidium sp. 370]
MADLVSRSKLAACGVVVCFVIMRLVIFVMRVCQEYRTQSAKPPGLITAGENDSTPSEEPDPKDSGDRSSPLESTEQETDNSTPPDESRPDNSLPPEEWYQMFYGDRFRPNRTLSPLQRGILPPGTVTFPSVGSPFSGTPKDPVLWRRPPVPGSRGFDQAHRGPRPANQQPSAGQSSASGSGPNAPN